MNEQFNGESHLLQKPTFQTRINSLSKSGSDIQNNKKAYLKWKEVKSQITDMKINGGKQQRKLISMVRCGIEDTIRHEIWPLLVNEPIKSYEYFKGKSQNKEISLDLERTFPNYKNSKELQYKMKLVLNALAMAIPDLGYCQGMNFIVGTILMQLSEEQCYKVTFHILHWQKHDLLLKNLDIIHQKLYALGSTNIEIRNQQKCISQNYIIGQKIIKSSQFFTHRLGLSRYIVTLCHSLIRIVFQNVICWKAKRFCTEWLFKYQRQRKKISNQKRVFRIQLMKQKIIVTQTKSKLIFSFDKCLKDILAKTKLIVILKSIEKSELKRFQIEFQFMIIAHFLHQNLKHLMTTNAILLILINLNQKVSNK